MPTSSESPGRRLGVTAHEGHIGRAGEAGGEIPHAVVDEVIELYSRDKSLDEVNAAHAALRNEPGAWKDEAKVLQKSKRATQCLK
jgi:hypothetical protein